MTQGDLPRLHFVGCGDAFGAGGRFQTCFYLTGGEQSLLIDCGASSLTALKAAGIEPNEISCVLLTHLHGDHFGGVPFLVLDGQFRGRERPLAVAGPPGTRERTEAAMNVLFPGSAVARRRFTIDFIELVPGRPTQVGPATVTTIGVELPDTPACALRVGYAARVVAYTGDTAWSDELIELARGADLVIAEAYFFERKVPFHLDYSTLRSHAGELDCERIILTHLSPDMLARQGDAEFDCAYDGLVVEL
jgi:ribonuclease BN (tRNA processing enzyme)